MYKMDTTSMANGTRYCLGDAMPTFSSVIVNILYIYYKRPISVVSISRVSWSVSASASKPSNCS